MHTPSSKPIKWTLAIAAGKGGVGKSTVAVHLALALKKQGFTVGILDADIYGPSLQQILPFTTPVLPHPQNKERLLPALAGEIKCISLAYFLREGEAAFWRAPRANGILEQFIHHVEWGVLDFLILDLPPGTGDVHLTLFQSLKLDGAVIVTMPQEVSLIDVRRTIHALEQSSVPIIGVIENMSFFEDPVSGEKRFLFGEGGGRRLSQEKGLFLLGEIPIDPRISLMADSGLVENFLNGDFSHFSFEKIARNIYHFVVSAETLGKKSAIPLRWPWNDPVEPIKFLKKKVITEKKEDSLCLIRSFQQLDSQRFVLEWSDGSQSIHDLSLLLANCPCIQCCDQRAQGFLREIGEIQAEYVETVGLYGLRIQFKNGCSRGIFYYHLLRRLECVK
jgi:ATP-binding protein involved in chromosome partitioning